MGARTKVYGTSASQPGDLGDLLESEATAGIEPAMKVLQIDGSIREPRYETPRKFGEIAPSD